VLGTLLEECKQRGIISVGDCQSTADLIFVLIDGAYYYLSLVKDAEEYEQKMEESKQHALRLINMRPSA